VTDPAQPRPVPGPPRPHAAPPPRPHAAPPERPAEDAGTPAEPRVAAAAEASPFADLAERPVAEHVAVYEAEHQRLQRELSTIDQL
jgi:hypothetical protein